MSHFLVTIVMELFWVVLSITSGIKYCRVKVISSWNEASTNSSYYKGLDLEAKKHYDIKIATLGNLRYPYMQRQRQHLKSG